MSSLAIAELGLGMYTLAPKEVANDGGKLRVRLSELYACHMRTQEQKPLPEWKQRLLDLQKPKHYETYTEAKEALEERVSRLKWEAGKYPTGHIEVQGDSVVLAQVPMSGDTLALFGIEPIGGSYRIINYEDLPDYMGN